MSDRRLCSSCAYAAKKGEPVFDNCPRCGTPPPDKQPAAETLDTKRYVHFDSMTWPTADSDLAWRLRYAQDSITVKDKFYLASVLNAYDELIRCGREKRETVCRTIRERK